MPKTQPSAPADVGHQGATDPWTSETPYTGHPVTPRPDPDHRPRAECGSCGQPTTQSTPRGTFTWCDECERQWSAETSRRLTTAHADLEACRQLAAAKADAARTSQPRPLGERMDIAGTFAVVLAGLSGSITRLRDPASPQLAAEAAEMTGRLNVLMQEISGCQHDPGPLAALAALGPDLEAEAADAEDLAQRIEAERAALETDAAMERERTRLIAARSAPLALPTAPAPVDLVKLASTSGIVTHAIDQWRTQRTRNGPCQGLHRFRAPTATRELTLSGPGKTPERVRICDAHNPGEICRGHGFTQYWETPLDRTEGTHLWV